MAVLGEKFGQTGDIAEAKIETHAGDRVQPLGGIADDDATPRTRARGPGDRQRVRRPAADLEEAPQAKSESPLHLGEKLGVRPRHGRLSCIPAQGQYESAASALDRQQSER